MNFTPNARLKSPILDDRDKLNYQRGDKKYFSDQLFDYRIRGVSTNVNGIAVVPLLALFNSFS